jgi:GNAT superfamily N-acetyltransferase
VSTKGALIRKPLAGDQDALLRMLGELGYPTDPDTLDSRLRRLEDDPGTQVFVAELDGEVMGLAVLHVMPLLERPPLGRITALVVSGSRRRLGIGRRLVEQAEEQARLAGCERLDLTTSEHRTDAHAFYRELGFAERSRRFVKDLTRI